MESLEYGGESPISARDGSIRNRTAENRKKNAGVFIGAWSWIQITEEQITLPSSVESESKCRAVSSILLRPGLRRR